MKAKTAFTACSWSFLVLGLLGLVGYTLSSSYEQMNPAPALCLLGLGFAGLGFRAYLDILRPPLPLPESPAVEDW
jgi:hypothetical protein